ncbi:unnamed protein product [Phaedon cochleariae]|uniref:Neurite outgrowth-associated protein n=1 Tax=Phaedon cochleariae TaxID=80249 RepID=A0A9N9SG58_PHACE|nr:unnamed protein product [Phaedon cochleariae]
MDLDDLETDFMNVQQSHKDHMREMEVKQEKLKYMIVKQKYFKEKYPNFLTWQDKEQIRYLHHKDPQDWTVDKLAESFPALPNIIMKILRSNFSKSDSKIVNHDANVQKNWKSFEKGEMTDLPEDLVEHLNKFTKRISRNNLVQYSSPVNNKKEIIVQPDAPREFSEIISSYERLKNKNRVQEEVKEVQTVSNYPSLPANPENSDTYLMIDKKNMKQRKHMTLTQLQNKIQTKALDGNILSEDEKMILKEINPPTETENISLAQVNEEDTTIIMNKFNSTGGSLVKKSERDYNHLIYPEKIRIPKDKVRKGYTYRLNDCFYDCDGEFLYRVPGMG